MGIFSWMVLRTSQIFGSYLVYSGILLRPNLLRVGHPCYQTDFLSYCLWIKPLSPSWKSFIVWYFYLFSDLCSNSRLSSESGSTTSTRQTSPPPDIQKDGDSDFAELSTLDDVEVSDQLIFVHVSFCNLYYLIHLLCTLFIWKLKKKTTTTTTTTKNKLMYHFQ